MRRPAFLTGVLLFVLTDFVTPAAFAQQQTFEPQVGQSGKDVVWVPTSEKLVEVMLDLAKVTPDDYVVDLGSGDGRNVIAAAKRGARARGFEYNSDMVDLSNRRARDAGVSEKATFVQGDMFEADFADATVLALFLLPSNFERLRPKFMDLKPGSRIVVNTFGVGGEWQPIETQKLESDCTSWCVAMLYIVPAKVAGTWRLADGELMLTQQVHALTGSLTVAGTTLSITNAHVNGDQITFTVNGTEYTGRVNGDSMEGTAGGRSWSASRMR
jgi:precorrin-6B methylase 2